MIVTSRPGHKLTSKIAGEAISPLFIRITSPVDVLLPSQPTVIVPPLLPEFLRQKEPKFSGCAASAVMEQGLVDEGEVLILFEGCVNIDCE